VLAPVSGSAGFRSSVFLSSWAKAEAANNETASKVAVRHVLRAAYRCPAKRAALAASDNLLAHYVLYKTEHKELPLFSQPDRGNEEKSSGLSDAFSGGRDT
jgi:hypothetical protein